MKLQHKLIAVFVAVITSIASYAYDCKVNGIYYDLDQAEKTAAVTYKKQRKASYKDTVSIPATITYNNIQYTVTSISNYAFCRSDALTQVVIPNTVTEIGESAFEDCKALLQIDIPQSVTKIDASAFSKCISLKQIDIPRSVTELGADAFWNCESLSRVDLPSSITKIGVGTFENCDALTSVDIPASVNEIGTGAFSKCYSLARVNIPASVTRIGEWAFWLCSALKQIDIPQSVAEIGENAFRDSGLTSVCLPASVKKLGKNAFAANYNLKTVVLLNPEAEGLEAAFLPPSVHDKSPIDKVVIPDGVPLNVNFSSAKIIAFTEFKLSSAGSLDAFIASMPFETWEQYYAKHHKKSPYNGSLSDIEADISAQIDKWQKKGEFESTSAWQQRVNEKTHQQKIDSLKSVYTTRANEVNKAYADEYNRLQREYEELYKRHYKELTDEYYAYHAGKAKKEFAGQTFELSAPYDPDNQSFLINTSSMGDILLPIPVADAPSFKSNWNSIRTRIEPVYVPDGDGVVLNKVIFTNNGKEYVYDSHTEAKYAVIDINYNFSPVQISDIDLDGMSIAANSIPDLPETQTVGKKAADAISVRNVAPEKKSMSVGTGTSAPAVAKAAPAPASDIDRNIPAGSRTSDRTFALVLANENYRRESAVPYAANDGRVFAEYLKKTLGVPDDNIQLVLDGSLNDLKFGLNKLSQICGAFPGEASVIVYYAGHGIPDESSKDAYLLPVDGYGSDPSTGFSLADLYKRLSEMPARQTTVFLDACFSGSERSGNMLRSARGVKIKPKAPTIGGNMVVFSATMDDETAYPYDQENHGLFTYFLLKKLQETKGNVSLGELADFIITKVKQTSILKNDKIQTPTVTASPLAPGWQNAKL